MTCMMVVQYLILDSIPHNESFIDLESRIRAGTQALAFTEVGRTWTAREAPGIRCESRGSVRYN